MFGFFTKKEKAPQVTFTTYFSKVMKYKMVLSKFSALQTNEPVVILYFFDQTRRELTELMHALHITFSSTLNQSSTGFVLFSAFDLSATSIPQNAQIIMIEPHPLAKVSQAAEKRISDSGVKNISIYVGLDEALPMAFGGDRIVVMLQKLGADPAEAFNHSMIDQSLRRGQEKLDKLNPFPTDVRTSPEDWLAKHTLA